MKVNNELLKKVFKILAQNPSKSYSLEELTMAVIPNNLLNQNISFERKFQAQVLNALISLENDGLIVLNLNTDESSIKSKGLFINDNFVS